MKRCHMCEEMLPRDEFNRHGRHKDGLQHACRRCVNSAARARRREPDHVPYTQKYKRRTGQSSRRQHAYRRTWKYGMRPCDLTVMRIKQTDRCAICDRVDTNMNIDHCHRTGKVRALLCGPCNRGIGQFKDDVERVRSAVIYLEKHL